MQDTQINKNNNNSKSEYLEKINHIPKTSSPKIIDINNVYESYRNKNVLVTGGAGFIGSNLAIKLCTSGANVLVVDSLIEDYGGNIFNLEPVKDKINLNIAESLKIILFVFLIILKSFLQAFLD